MAVLLAAVVSGVEHLETRNLNHEHGRAENVSRMVRCEPQTARDNNILVVVDGDRVVHRRQHVCFAVQFSSFVTVVAATVREELGRVAQNLLDADSIHHCQIVDGFCRVGHVHLAITFAEVCLYVSDGRRSEAKPGQARRAELTLSIIYGSAAAWSTWKLGSVQSYFQLVGAATH
jgi:hypothetical protein